MGHFDLHTDDITFETWVYWPGTTDPQGGFFVSKSIKTTGGNRWAISIMDTNVIRFLYTPSSTTAADVFSSGTVPLNTWSHIAVVLERGVSTKIYINGVLDTTGPSINNDDYNSSYNFHIGSYNTAGNDGPALSFPGKMADFRMWRKVRTQQEINDNMNNRLTLTQIQDPQLIHYLKFESGNIGIDSSTYDKHGTVEGTPTIESNPPIT